MEELDDEEGLALQEAISVIFGWFMFRPLSWSLR
jgi:hypothetical protein